MTLAALTQEFDALSIDEQLEYVDVLWQRIAARPEALPVPNWHREILRERLAAYESGSEPLVAWEDVRTELLGK